MARARERLADEENSPSDIEAWLQTFAGRGAVLYILKALYVRVLEDQGLLHPLRIRAGGSYELFQRLFPNLGIAAYLRRIFDDGARVLPELFAPTAVEIATPGEPSARELWSVWQAAAPGGGPKFDFRGELDTRFIGDLYQDLDPDVKKRYALLQTPRFVEEFILDHTLDPALDKFGLDKFRIIDPTCGSGHFLLGAFERLVRAWRERLGDGPEARWNAAVLAIASIYGADLNEYACALSRFRLLLAVVRETRVTDAVMLRSLHLNIITCDSLIPWERIAAHVLPGMAEHSWLASYGTESERERNEAFFANSFHAVVGNPPYIQVSDSKKRDDYRRAWPRSVAGQFALSAPMAERFLLLPVNDGFAGFIIGSAFTKQTFGKRVVTTVFPDVSFGLIVECSAVSIPGHGTSTVMLFAQKQRSEPRQTVRVISGKRGNPTDAVEPERGLVWSDICRHVEDVEFEDDWISISAVPMALLCAHPWSVGDRVTGALMNHLRGARALREVIADIGRTVEVVEDAAFFRRYSRSLPQEQVVIGESVRDWTIERELTVLCPYDERVICSEEMAAVDLWHLRTTLSMRRRFGATFKEHGVPWWSYGQYTDSRMFPPRPKIVFPYTATGVNFAVDSSSALFTRTAPVILLKDESKEIALGYCAILNSSVLDFWFKQTCLKRSGDPSGDTRVLGDPWETYYVWNTGDFYKVPIPYRLSVKLVELAKVIEQNVASVAQAQPAVIISACSAADVSQRLDAARVRELSWKQELIGLQEELDWLLYEEFGLLPTSPQLQKPQVTTLSIGHRAFEIALARKTLRGEDEGRWFTENGIDIVGDVPAEYSDDMRTVLERRLEIIETNDQIACLEQPNFKRLWQFEPWETRAKRAANEWLLDRLEAELDRSPKMLTTDELVDQLGNEAKVVAVYGLAKLPSETTLGESLARLLSDEALPDNTARIFSATGLAKHVGSQTAYIGASRGVPPDQSFQSGEHVNWKRLWRLQEREDAKETVTVTAPPPFVRADYAHRNGWRLRGKLNVSNERFIVYDELRPIRYAWGGWTTSDRAALSLQAFELRGREPDNAPEKPEEAEPQRCGIQFALWDKIDELRRTGDPLHDEVRTIAKLCGRACPCDVIYEWRNLAPVRGNGRTRTRAVSATEPRAVPTGRRHEIDADAIERLLALLHSSGDVGLPMSGLEQLFSGNREAARNTLEILRSDGRVEAVGKGRGVRYRLPQAGLF